MAELGQFLSVLSEGDLQHFVVDEGILLAFITASSKIRLANLKALIKICLFNASFMIFFLKPAYLC